MPATILLRENNPESIEVFRPDQGVAIPGFWLTASLRWTKSLVGSSSMGSSFVSMGDQGFWMRDAILEVWLRLLALHVEDPSQPGSVAAQIRDQWLLASRGFFMGCIPVGLDEAVSTPEGAAVVRSAISSLVAALEKGPGFISRSVLNVMGMSGEFSADFSTSGLIEVAHAFNDLLEGRITSRASDTDFVPGSLRR